MSTQNFAGSCYAYIENRQIERENPLKEQQRYEVKKIREMND